MSDRFPSLGNFYVRLSHSFSKTNEAPFFVLVFFVFCLPSQFKSCRNSSMPSGKTVLINSLSLRNFLISFGLLVLTKEIPILTNGSPWYHNYMKYPKGESQVTLHVPWNIRKGNLKWHLTYHGISDINTSRTVEFRIPDSRYTFKTVELRSKPINNTGWE